MNIFAKYQLDTIVYPHQKRLVVKIGESQRERNGCLVCHGVPVLCSACGIYKPSDTAPIGIPVGMEMICKEWDEPLLFELAYSFEQATKFRKAPAL